MEVLRRIPYRLNSNDFHFDTEIVIQLFNAGARVAELPIPTYYGDEICRVNGMRYAKNVLLATVKNVAHRSGLLYQRRFDPITTENRYYDLKLGFPSSHSWALEAIPQGASVIDIGSGPGGIARELVKKACPTAVVDRFAPPGRIPGITVFVQDLDEPPKFDVRTSSFSTSSSI